MCALYFTVKMRFSSPRVTKIASLMAVFRLFVWKILNFVEPQKGHYNTAPRGLAIRQLI